jgi:uncharacterized peroxidase-related enzyme
VSEFTLHTIESAPAGSKPALERLGKEVGFVPNLAATMAESPTLIEAFTGIRSTNRAGTLTRIEREVVALVTAFEASCAYCMSAHSTFAKMAGAGSDLIETLRVGELPEDPRLRALATYTRHVVRARGQVAIDEVRELVRAGFTPAQSLEVFVGVAMTTLSTQAYHVTNAPIDEAFRPMAWELQAAL